MATAQVVVVHCLVVVAEDQQAVVRAEAALEAQSVSFTPATRANSRQLTWQTHKGIFMAEKWIQKAIKKPGALRAELGAKPGKPIPAKKLAAAAKKPGVEGKRARLAETLKGLKK
jgi:hypothetical protein